MQFEESTHDAYVLQGYKNTDSVKSLLMHDRNEMTTGIAAQ